MENDEKDINDYSLEEMLDLCTKEINRQNSKLLDSFIDYYEILSHCCNVQISAHVKSFMVGNPMYEFGSIMMEEVMNLTEILRFYISRKLWDWVVNNIFEVNVKKLESFVVVESPIIQLNFPNEKSRKFFAKMNFRQTYPN